jgi:hypothetical protein
VLVNTVENTGSSERDVPLRFSMSSADTERVCAQLLAGRGSPSAVALRELIWLRAVLIEQWRRTPVVERDRFAQRADRILGQLDRSRLVGLSEAAITVRQHEKP